MRGRNGRETYSDVAKESTDVLGEAGMAAEEVEIGHVGVEEAKRERFEVKNDGELCEDGGAVGEDDVELRDDRISRGQTRERTGRTLRIVTEKSSSNPPSKASFNASPADVPTTSSLDQSSITSAASAAINEASPSTRSR